jgi:hypothetical protein
MNRRPKAIQYSHLDSHNSTWKTYLRVSTAFNKANTPYTFFNFENDTWGYIIKQYLKSETTGWNYVLP